MKCIVVVLFIVYIIACSKPQTITQQEAEKLAAAKLEKYVEQEGLSIAQFEKPEVRYVEKDAGGQDIYVWEVHYVSKGNSIHNVNILVGRYGGAELHSMIYKK